MKVAKHFSIYADLHVRRVDDLQPMQEQYRFALEYLVNDKFSFMPVGYAYTHNYVFGAQPATYENNEHRLFQQLLYRHKAGRFRFFQRLRFEERFIQVHSMNAAGEIVDEGFGENYQFRIRYRFNATYPLGSETITPGKYHLVFFDELFVSRGERVSVSFPDQNRFFMGAGYQFSKGISVNTGFFYQILIKPSGLQQENNLGLAAHIFCNFDLSKKS